MCTLLPMPRAEATKFEPWQISKARFNGNDNGVLIGGSSFGFNWQFSNLVLRFEGDVDWDSSRENGVFIPALGIGPDHCPIIDGSRLLQPHRLSDRVSASARTHLALRKDALIPHAVQTVG